jgi:hypothetical protein
MGGQRFRIRVGHQGLFFDRLDAVATADPLVVGGRGIYQNRNRSYDPVLGRFLQRDPNGSGVPVLAAMAMHGGRFSAALAGTSPGKAEDARRLGASDVVISRDEEQMKRNLGRLDVIINTVSAPHDINALLAQLRRDGTMVMVGAPDRPHPPTDMFTLIFARRRMAGSLIGGIPETQEMLDFCGQHNITADIELIPMQKINDALRAHAQKRCQVPLRDRPRLPEAIVEPIAQAIDDSPLYSASLTPNRSHSPGTESH